MKQGGSATLVTGGAGFLGSHLVNSLVADGRRVIAIDNLSTGRVANLAGALESGSATFVFADVATTPQRLREIAATAKIAAIETIYHLASPASPEAYGRHPWETLAVNGTGTMSLIELALERGARFVFASTSEIYGDPLVHPQPEDYFGNVDPVGPRSCYDEGKRFGEAAVAAAVRARELDGRIVRFFNCYGPAMERGDGRLIPQFMEAALDGKPFPVHGSGLQTRSLTYVADAIALLRRFAELPAPRLGPINVGNDDERTVLEIARAIAEIANVPLRCEHLPAREGDPQRRRPDLAYARSIGWSPATTLGDGLRRTLDWFRADRFSYA
ncbi:MAG: NAD-dependent epimerase/dehydratase family protein [Vulcanimicrobiaceae bacterium]